MEESVDDVETQDSTEVQETGENAERTKTKGRRKRKYQSSASASANSMIQWLHKYSTEKKEAEEEKLKGAEKMHQEKLSVLKDLVNILKNN